MAFQRGLKVKEAMDIGDHHIAPIIETLFFLDPTNQMSHPDGSYGPDRVALSENRTEEILILIQRGQAPKKLRFYAFRTKDGELTRLHKYVDRYVSFKNKKYKIIEPTNQ